jgi:hypothetical protein
VQRGWDVERIHAEHDTEVRRIAIERLGWTTYLRRTRAKPVAAAPDLGACPTSSSPTEPDVRRMR